MTVGRLRMTRLVLDEPILKRAVPIKMGVNEAWRILDDLVGRG
jgi:hypothetical protein